MSSNRRFHGERPRGLPKGMADRRCVYRYPAALKRAWLGWHKGEQFRTTTAEIRDLSLGGAKLYVQTLPPAIPWVWFCPDGVTTKEWIEARLVQARKHLFGPRRVCIAFRRPIAYEYFKKIVFGPEAVGGLHPQGGPFEVIPPDQKSLWR